MALKLKPKPGSVTKEVKAKPKVLTLEEVREKYEFGTQERAVAEITEFTARTDEARIAANAANRAKTQAGKALKVFNDQHDLKPLDELQIGDTPWRYDVAYSEKIDPRKLYDMMKTKKITEEQFLSVISVQKGPAGILIGAHVLASITETVPGKEFDIRKGEALATPVAEPIVVKKGIPPKSKSKLNDAVSQPIGTTKGAARLKKLRKVSVG
jgi:hypothetical protein